MNPDTVISGFADEMVRQGHFVFRCMDCGAAMWLEADNPETGENLQMMRYATTVVDDCIICYTIMSKISDDPLDYVKVWEEIHDAKED